MTSLFVVIGSKVLGTGYEFVVAIALAWVTLHTLDELRSHHTTEQRVFAVVLLLTTPAWVTTHIDGGRPNVETYLPTLNEGVALIGTMHMVCARLCRGHIGTSLHEFRVPSG